MPLPPFQLEELKQQLEHQEEGAGPAAPGSGEAAGWGLGQRGPRGVPASGKSGASFSPREQQTQKGFSI